MDRLAASSGRGMYIRFTRRRLQQERVALTYHPLTVTTKLLTATTKIGVCS